MKNIIIGLIIGIFLNGLVSFAKEKTIVNPFQNIATVQSSTIKTTKMVTPDGTYRLFVATSGYSYGITAIKIK